MVVDSYCHVLTTLPWERDPVLIAQVAGWAQDWYGRVWKISPPLGFGPQNVQPEVRCCSYYLVYVL